MEPVSINQALAGRTILIAPSGERDLAAELTLHGALVIAWPKVEIIDPESFADLDEAIQNLFGYDWLIFANTHAAGFFLRRLQNLGHEISELDALRVCALDAATRQQLEEAHVHVDLVPEQPATDGVLAALETYTAERNSLRGLNFLLPRAIISRDYLRQAIEDAGARADSVAAYRTVRGDNSRLARISTLLAGGGIDCVAFAKPSEVTNLAQLSDTSDLSRLLTGVAVACIDDITALTAEQFGLRPQVRLKAFTLPDLVLAIASCFPTEGGLL